MKYLTKVVVAAAVLLIYVQCTNSQQRQVQVLTASEFNSKLKQSEIVLIDVRTKDEIAQGKIRGAQQIDFTSPNFESQIKELDMNKVYLVYCAAGGRSNKAASKMIDLGFKEVYDLDGGMGAWKSAGLPID